MWTPLPAADRIVHLLHLTLVKQAGTLKRHFKTHGGEKPKQLQPMRVELGVDIRAVCVACVCAYDISIHLLIWANKCLQCPLRHFNTRAPFQCNCLQWGNVEPGSAYHKERDVDEGCYDNLYSPYNQERMKQMQDISTKLFQCNWLQWVVMFNPGATMSRQCIFHEVKTRKSKDISTQVTMGR